MIKVGQRYKYRSTGISEISKILDEVSIRIAVPGNAFDCRKKDEIMTSLQICSDGRIGGAKLLFGQDAE